MKLEDFIKKHGNVNVDEKELKKVLGIKDEKYFIPKENEKYFVVDFQGEIFGEDNNSNYDKDIFENNEVFRTFEEAEEHAKKQRFLLKMKRDFLDNSENLNWTNDYQYKYHLAYDHEFDKILIQHYLCLTKSLLNTTNKEWLEEYIDKYEDEIKRYYFDIKEEK